MNNAREWASNLQANLCVSYWLKDALTVLFRRDPLDAERDAELLHRIMQRHLSETQDTFPGLFLDATAENIPYCGEVRP